MPNSSFDRLTTLSNIEGPISVRPTVHRDGLEESRPQVEDSSKPSVRTAGRTEIGPSMLLRVVSLSNERFSIFEMASR